MHGNSVDSLSKLYRKIKSIDSFLDDRSDMSTARVAWSEIRENIERGEYSVRLLCFYQCPALEAQAR